LTVVVPHPAVRAGGEIKAVVLQHDGGP
jgi:hypothetical protein